MKKSNLPTRKQCFGLLKKFGTPSHIIEHSLAAAKLAVFLAERLNEKGILVDVQLVDRACLLHDILRVCDLNDYSRFEHCAADKAKWEKLKSQYKGICHEEATAALLRDKYPQLAEVIRKHRYTAIAHQKDKPVTWEEKLVYYADKRVMHDRIVSLKERLEEAHKRYDDWGRANAHSSLDSFDYAQDKTVKIDRLIYKLEKEIFDKIGLDPLAVTDKFIDSYPNCSNLLPFKIPRRSFDIGNLNK